MKNEHLTFDIISDICDGDIPQVNREDILNHLKLCRLCGNEYKKLNVTLEFLIKISRECGDFGDISDLVIKRYKIRKRRYLFYKSMPAIAASIIFITGTAFYKSGVLDNFSGGERSTASNEQRADYYDQTEIEKIISIIQKNDASIFRITDMYIEGEISVNDFKKIRRDLGFRKVVYTIIPPESYSSVNAESNFIWKNKIEEVSLGNRNGINSNTDRPIESNNSGKIRFRVFR